MSVPSDRERMRGSRPAESILNHEVVCPSVFRRDSSTNSGGLSSTPTRSSLSHATAGRELRRRARLAKSNGRYRPFFDRLLTARAGRQSIRGAQSPRPMPIDEWPTVAAFIVVPSFERPHRAENGLAISKRTAAGRTADVWCRFVWRRRERWGVLTSRGHCGYRVGYRLRDAGARPKSPWQVLYAAPRVMMDCGRR